MTTDGPSRRQRRPWRRLLVIAALVAVTLLSATGAIDLLPAGGGVAIGGSQPVHHATVGPTSLPDDVLPPPGAPQTVALPVPAGPQLVVPIFYYHYVRSIQPTAQDLLSWQLSIPPTLFAQQMALLHVEGAHTITLATLMDALSGKTALPSRPVVLTFDDGYADFATTVEPVLARYGFVATDYVVSGFINRPRYMTAAQILQMDADGMVIGAHTVHHVDLAVVPPAEASAEIDASKTALERLLGHPVLDFAYPYGAFNPAVVQMTEQAGFRDAVSTIRGDDQSLNGRFEMHRTEMGGAPTLSAFAEDADVPLPSSAQYAVIANLARQPTGDTIA